MNLESLIAFILGGLVSAIIFYPRKNKKEIENLAYILSFQFHLGIYFAQTKPETPKINSELQMHIAAHASKRNFEEAAKLAYKMLKESV